MPYALALIDFDAGAVVPHDLAAAHLPVEDLTVHRGEGIFETALVTVDPASGAPRVHGADLHFARFRASAQALALPAPPRELFDKAISTVVEATLGDADEFAVRYAMSRGLDSHADAEALRAAGVSTGAHGWVFSASVTAAQKAQRADGIRAVTADRGYPAYIGESAPWLLVGAKTLSYAVNEAASREARARGADEALFVSHDGVVLEGPNSTLVIRRGDTLLTPDPRAGLLHGTTQRAVFAGAQEEGWKTGYTDLSVEDVLAADGAWMVSSVRTAVPILGLDGTDLPAQSELTARMHAWIRAR